MEGLTHQAGSTEEDGLKTSCFSTGLDGCSHADLLLLWPGAGVPDCTGELQHFPQQCLQVCWVFSSLLHGGECSWVREGVRVSLWCLIFVYPTLHSWPLDRDLQVVSFLSFSLLETPSLSAVSTPPRAYLPDLLFSPSLASCRTSQRSPSQSWPPQVSRNPGSNATATFESSLSVSMGSSQAFPDQDPQVCSPFCMLSHEMGLRHLWLMFITLWLQGTSLLAFNVHLLLMLKFYVLLLQ